MLSIPLVENPQHLENVEGYNMTVSQKRKAKVTARGQNIDGLASKSDVKLLLQCPEFR